MGSEAINLLDTKFAASDFLVCKETILFKALVRALSVPLAISLTKDSSHPPMAIFPTGPGMVPPIPLCVWVAVK